MEDHLDTLHLQGHRQTDDQDANESGNESEGNGDNNVYSFGEEELSHGIEALMVEQYASVQQMLLDFQMQAQTLMAKRKSAIVMMEAELRELRVENRDLRERCASAGMSLVEMDNRQCETGGTGEASSSASPACNTTVAMPPAQPKKKHRQPPQSSALRAVVPQPAPAPAVLTPVSPPGLPPDLDSYTMVRPKPPSHFKAVAPKGPVPQMDLPGTLHGDAELTADTDIQGTSRNDGGTDIGNVKSLSSDDGNSVSELGDNDRVREKDFEEIDGKNVHDTSNVEKIQPQSKAEQFMKASNGGQVPAGHTMQSGAKLVAVVPEPSRDAQIKTASFATDVDSAMSDLERAQSGNLRQSTASRSGNPSPFAVCGSAMGQDNDLCADTNPEIIGAEGQKKVPQAVFADAAAMKDKVRQAIVRPPYNVHDLYHKDGFWQAVARSTIFDNVTLGVIAANALWIAVDTDLNKADTVAQADFFFQFMENFFCAYFSVEWFTRFMAFQNKTKAFTDYWFSFDSALVIMMVVETWMMYLFVLSLGGSASGALGNASVLRLFRLLRLSRMARMARLLRAMPELMILLKGIKVAMRSVFFTLCLLMLIIYVFAVGFTQALQDTDAADWGFQSVPDSINSLLMKGVLPDQNELVEVVGQEHFAYRCAILTYILLASLTVMNMLVGVLCEVVSVVSSVEKETLLVNFVKQQLQPMLNSDGGHTDYNTKISKGDFSRLLEQQQAARALQDVGVDVVSLVDFTDFIFQNGKELTFSDCMDVVLQLRGTNASTVKDIVDLRKQVLSELAALKEDAERRWRQITQILQPLRKTFDDTMNSRRTRSGPQVKNQRESFTFETSTTEVLEPSSGGDGEYVPGAVAELR